MPQEHIVVRGAREHNLKNVDVEIPRNKLVVITGLSGSGKSSLAFDTIFAEGQRRYVESLSAYARQFLGQMEKPDVDDIQGLSPAISIDQKGASHNPRSTVGTVTEIYDYLRLLYARIGQPHCPKCGRPITKQTVQQIVDVIQAFPDGSRLLILAPVVQDRKGEHQQVFDDARKGGYVRVRVDGEVYDLSEEFNLAKNKKHTIEIVVDRLVVRSAGSNGSSVDENAARIADSVETALGLGHGVVKVAIQGGEEHLFSEHFACVYCGISLPEIQPRSFSFNSPHGACPACSGLGTSLEVDPDLIIPNPDLSIEEGAIVPWARGGTTSSYFLQMVASLAQTLGFSLNTPFKELRPEHQQAILYGVKDQKVLMRYSTRDGRTHEYEAAFEGVVKNLERRYRETDSDFQRMEIERYMTNRPCSACKGARLKPEVLAVTVGGRSIVEVTALSVREADQWFRELTMRLS
ncbi:MAG TPA: excinuclease ABC subunit UvrA, partial [Chloroflexota bacterium]|nr:excinuclease ABC subunit UvrA [Chloroflexota bacterium]